MTAATLSRQHFEAPASVVRGWWTMIIVLLRTTWVRIAGSIALVGLIVIAVGQGISDLFATAVQRQAYAMLAEGSPTFAVFNGKAYDLTGLGGITVVRVGFIGMILFPLLAAALAVLLTRTQEDAGRLELFTAYKVSRLAPLLSATVILTATTVVIGAVVWAGLSAIGLPTSGSLRYGAAITALMLAFGFLGLLAGQLASNSHSALGLSLVAVGVSFLVRAVIDGSRWDAPWATPMSWFEETHPYGDTQSWPYVALLGFAAAALVASFAVARRRDLGAGLITPRPGPATVNGTAGPFWLALRLTRATWLTWLIGTVVWGLAMGWASDQTRQFLRDNPTLAQAFGASTDPTKSFLAIASALTVLLAIVPALQSATRLASEEQSGRLGMLCSGSYSRPTWWATLTLMPLAQTSVILLAGATALATGCAVASGQPSDFGTAFGACLAQLPAVIFTGTVAFLLTAIHPRLPLLAWALLAWEAVVALLADTLQLDDWARNLSPLHLSGQVPVDAPNSAALILLGIASVVVFAVSLTIFGRRSVKAG